MAALEVLCVSAAEAQIDLNILIDNTEVQSSVTALLTGKFRVPRGAFGRWCDIAHAVGIGLIRHIGRRRMTSK